MKHSDGHRRRWTWFLGPWPFQPALTTGLLLVFYVSVQAGALGQRGLVDAEFRWGILVTCVFLIATAWGILRLGRLWQDSHGVHWGSYLVTLLILAGLSSLTRLVRELSSLPDAEVYVALSYGRTFPLVLIIATLVGTAFDALARQVAATEAALEVAREQQVQIITADEEARRQVAVLLHDRVQSGLLGTCLELRAISRRQPSLTAELQELVDRLETIRAFDVRHAAHVLSPNLADVDLQTAIEDLAASFSAAFTTEVRLDPLVERDLQHDAPLTALAIYRILDQALLNIAAHAGATQVHIDIDKQADGYTVTVRDNGRGLPTEPVTGLGSTIITTWVRATDGTWGIAASPGGRGTTLQATLGSRAISAATALGVDRPPY